MKVNKYMLEIMSISPLGKQMLGRTKRSYRLSRPVGKGTPVLLQNMIDGVTV